MAVAGSSTGSLRLERAASSRLAWAMAISLACHLVVGGVYGIGEKLNWWDSARWPHWLKKNRIVAALIQKKQPPPAPILQEPPLLFVEVSPAQAAVEPPKNAKYYSDKNSHAANPTPKEADVPEITGTQKEMVKTEDTAPQKKFMPLQPSPPPAEPAPEKQEEQKPQAALDPGDLALARPNPVPAPPAKENGQAAHSRPRTLREAMARVQDHQLIGKKMRQEGGVRNHLEISTLDAKATPFGAYDYALIQAIQQCWYNLLDDQLYAADYHGKVVLQFELHEDGRVTDLSIAQNTAGTVAGLLCQTAVDKPNPYPPFPADMRRMTGESRKIQFTFFYNY